MSKLRIKVRREINNCREDVSHYWAIDNSKENKTKKVLLMNPTFKRRVIQEMLADKIFAEKNGTPDEELFTDLFQGVEVFLSPNVKGFEVRLIDANMELPSNRAMLDNDRLLSGIKPVFNPYSVPVGAKLLPVEYFTLATVENECWGHGLYKDVTSIREKAPFDAEVSFHPLFKTEDDAQKYINEMENNVHNYKIVKLEVM